MFYRFNQLLRAVFATVHQREHEWVHGILTADEQSIFYRQTLTEQRHAIDVALDIHNQQAAIVELYGNIFYEDLLHAALLHDCGKSLFPHRIWQRIFIVFICHCPDQWQRLLVRKKNIFGKTLVIYKRHPAWGKKITAKAGVPKEIQALIANHHTPTTPLEHILYAADNRH
jgi:hypothetical protein